MTERFTTSQWVPFPLELVFAFFADPANLPRLMPANLQTKIEDARIVPPPTSSHSSNIKSIAAGIGSEIAISFRPIPLVPFRVRWTARIVEFEWNHHFCDEQTQGPFASFRHCHYTQSEIRDGIAGTLVTDEIAFKMPFGIFGRSGAVFVRRNLNASFRHRQDQLPRLLAGSARRA